MAVAKWMSVDVKQANKHTSTVEPLLLNTLLRQNMCKVTLAYLYLQSVTPLSKIAPIYSI